MTNVPTDRAKEGRILVEKEENGGVIKKVAKEQEEEREEPGAENRY
jgi:hypothetical protein